MMVQGSDPETKNMRGELDGNAQRNDGMQRVPTRSGNGYVLGVGSLRFAKGRVAPR
jgi:hypothetical protein